MSKCFVCREKIGEKAFFWDYGKVTADLKQAEKLLGYSDLHCSQACLDKSPQCVARLNREEIKQGLKAAPATRKSKKAKK